MVWHLFLIVSVFILRCWFCPFVKFSQPNWLLCVKIILDSIIDIDIDKFLTIFVVHVQSAEHLCISQRENTGFPRLNQHHQFQNVSTEMFIIKCATTILQTIKDLKRGIAIFLLFKYKLINFRNTQSWCVGWHNYVILKVWYTIIELILWNCNEKLKLNQAITIGFCFCFLFVCLFFRYAEFEVWLST